MPEERTAAQGRRVNAEDVHGVLCRFARLHGWDRSHNQLDYYGLRFTRPEPDGGLSRVWVRVTHRAVDARVEVAGESTQRAFPELSWIQQVLSAPVPQPAE